MDTLKLINPEKAFEITGGSEELFCQIMDLFIQISPDQIQRVKESYSRENWTELYASAHDIKSSASSFGGELLYNEALILEQNAKKEKELENIFKNIDLVEKSILNTINSYNSQNWKEIFKKEK